MALSRENQRRTHGHTLNAPILSACESVSSTDPTVLPARKVVLALASDPLDNHEIAFGVVRFALHLFSQRCVWRWGSVLPTVARARRRHFGASPLRRRFLFRRSIAHPCACAAAWLGSEYLPQALRLASAPVCAIPPLAGIPGPVADAPRPPAPYVGYPVSFEYGASLMACAYRCAKEVFKALLCTGRMGKHSKTMSIWHSRFWAQRLPERHILLHAALCAAVRRGCAARGKRDTRPMA